MSVPLRRALVAAAITCSLAGCATTTTGFAGATWNGNQPAWATPASGEWTPTPDPVPAAPPTTAAPQTTIPSPAAPPQSAPPAALDATPYAEWIALGWTPVPWVPVTDRRSGATVALLGKPSVRSTTGTAGSASTTGTIYTSDAGPRGIVTVVGTYTLPSGFRADLTVTANAYAASLNGRVVQSQPTTVAGNPGLDLRIESATGSGTPVLDLVRVVLTPTHLVALEIRGHPSDSRTVQQVADHVVASLQFPQA